MSIKEAIQKLEQAKQDIKETPNEDDNWTKTWEDVQSIAEDIDDTKATDLADYANGGYYGSDIENGDDMKSFYAELISEQNDTDFMQLYNYMAGGAQIKYEDVLYMTDPDNVRNVHEMTEDEANEVIDDMVSAVKGITKSRS